MAPSATATTTAGGPELLEQRLEVCGSGVHVVRAGLGRRAGASVVVADDAVVALELGDQRVEHRGVGGPEGGEDDEGAGAVLRVVDLDAVRALQTGHARIV